MTSEGELPRWTPSRLFRFRSTAKPSLTLALINLRPVVPAAAGHMVNLAGLADVALYQATGCGKLLLGSTNGAHALNTNV